MDAKELLEELKAKADELHKYLEANPEEANMVPSWMFSCFSTEKGFLLQGCSNVQHGAEVVVQFLHKLSENSIAAFMLVALEVANLMNAKRKEIEGTGEGESPQWIQ
ncbi:MAG: hypothetical protein WCQ69_10645 [Bacteroidales bacterium]